MSRINRAHIRYCTLETDRDHSFIIINNTWKCQLLEHAREVPGGSLRAVRSLLGSRFSGNLRALCVFDIHTCDGNVLKPL